MLARSNMFSQFYIGKCTLDWEKVHQVAVRKGPNRNLYYSIILPYSTILLHAQSRKTFKSQNINCVRWCTSKQVLYACLFSLSFWNKNVQLIVAMKHMAKIRMICAEICDLSVLESKSNLDPKIRTSKILSLL